jgi:tol-pal system protein YbgF
MMIKHILTITGCLFLLSACVPQAQLVQTRAEMIDQREKSKGMKLQVRDLQRRLEMLESDSRGTADSQNAMADYGARADQLATDIQILQGKLEENNFHIAELAQKFDDKSVKIAELASRTDDLEAKMKLLNAGTGTLAAEPSGTTLNKDLQPVQGSIAPTDAYRQAKIDFDKGNFDLALAGFQNYLDRFPDTFLAAGAQYWIGECYFSKKEFTKAISAFERVIQSYPRSNKVSGAKLKIGLSYLNDNRSADARDHLNKVIQEYPRTNEAEIAKDRLSRIVN